MVERFERFTYAIFEISRHWHKLTGMEMEKYGLRGPHAIYLLTLYRYPEGLTAPQLCKLCGKDKSDVSRMIAAMEKKQLVIKEGTHQNQYGGVFKLTEAGNIAAGQVCERANLAVALAGKDLTEEKRAIFYEALESVASNMRKLSKEGLPLS